MAVVLKLWWVSESLGELGKNTRAIVYLTSMSLEFLYSLLFFQAIVTIYILKATALWIARK